MEYGLSIFASTASLTSSGTAVATPIPFDTQGGFPRHIRVSTTANCYVAVGDLGVTAVAGDMLLQAGDAQLLHVSDCKAISILSVSGSATVNVAAMELGNWSTDQRTLDYNFTTLTAVPAPVTYTGGSSRTFFGSDGLLKVQGYNLLTYSQDFSNVTNWSMNNATAGASSITETLASGVHGLFAAAPNRPTFTAAEPFALTARIGKTSTCRYVSAAVSAGAAGVYVVIDTTTGSITKASTKGAGYTLVTSSCSDDGTNWVIKATGTASAAAQVTTVSGESSGTPAANESTYTGTGAVIVINGVQLERSSTASQYSPTTTAANSAPRLDYDPATLLPRGLLIEEQRTNSLLHSRDMTQAAWTKADVTAARTQVGIDGTANSACLMTEGSAGNAVMAQGSLSVAAGSTITGSAVLKRGSTDWVRFVLGESTGTDGASAWFNLATGTKGAVAARGVGTNNSSTITSLGGGWYRCTVTTLPNGAYTSAGINLISSASADASSTRVPNATYIVDCAQLEVGSFATSPIITGAATATRSADSVSMTGTNFSSWFNATQGTFVAEFDVARSVTSTVNAGVVGAGAGARFAYIPATSNGLSSWDGTTQLITANALTYNATTKVASSYTAGVSRSMCLNGGTVATTATCAAAYTAGTALHIGDFQSGSNTQLNGHVRRVQFYPVALPSAIQSLTA